MSQLRKNTVEFPMVQMILQVPNTQTAQTEHGEVVFPFERLARRFIKQASARAVL